MKTAGGGRRAAQLAGGGWPARGRGERQAAVSLCWAEGTVQNQFRPPPAARRRVQSPFAFGTFKSFNRATTSCAALSVLTSRSTWRILPSGPM